jgi:hypothetical protein
LIDGVKRLPFYYGLKELSPATASTGLNELTMFINGPMKEYKLIPCANWPKELVEELGMNGTYERVTIM